MTFSTALRLGRVSNLPTVWSNAFAASLLSGAASGPRDWALLGALLSLFYLGGMYLNDAFDREIDARERPERPIPSGAVAARTVFAIGFGLLGLGIVGLTWFGSQRGHAGAAALTGSLLAGIVILYDVWHKGHGFARAIMGLCRAGVYVACAATLNGVVSSVIGCAAAALALYVTGLSGIAAQENQGRLRSWVPGVLVASPAIASLLYGALELTLALPLAAHALWTGLAIRRIGTGDVPGGVVRLIAGICWVDALLVIALRPPGSSESVWTVALAGVLVALTRRWQRHVPGT